MQDEGSFHLKDTAKSLLKSLGSQVAASLGWRDMWTFVGKKGGERAAMDGSASPAPGNTGLPLPGRKGSSSPHPLDMSLCRGGMGHPGGLTALLSRWELASLT